MIGDGVSDVDGGEGVTENLVAAYLNLVLILSIGDKQGAPSLLSPRHLHPLTTSTGAFGDVGVEEIALAMLSNSP